MRKCLICEDIHADFKSRKNIFLEETEYFSLIADLSPLSRGHLLIISNDHYNTFSDVASLDPIAYKNVLCFIDKISELSSKNNIEFVLIEHGSSGKPGKQTSCCEHAHIHYLPMDINQIEKLKEAFFDWDCGSEKIKGLETLHEYCSYSYNFLKSSLENEVHIWTSSSLLPHQALRRAILGDEGYSCWSKNINVESAMESVEFYRILKEGNNENCAKAR